MQLKLKTYSMVFFCHNILDVLMYTTSNHFYLLIFQENLKIEGKGSAKIERKTLKGVVKIFTCQTRYIN